MRRILLLILGLCFSLASNAQYVLYGSQHVTNAGMSTLYQINPADASSKIIGPIGFERCGAIAAHPITDVLYGVAERAGTNIKVLITINKSTGAGTEIGPLGAIYDGGGTMGVPDITFNSSGDLYAQSGAIIGFIRINASNGSATPVAALQGFTMEFDNNDILRGHSLFASYIINPLNGNTTFTNNWTPATWIMNCMAHNPADNQMFCILRGGAGGGPRTLISLDYTTAMRTTIGALPNGISGMAFSIPPKNIPTVSEWGLILLFLSFLSVGGGLMYKRNEKTSIAY